VSDSSFIDQSYISVAVIALLGILAGYVFGSEPSLLWDDREPDNLGLGDPDVSKNIDFAESQVSNPNTAYNCTGGRQVCSVERYEHVNRGCNPWYPWSPEEKPSCEVEKPTENISKNLAVVGDRANFVLGNFTSLNYRAEYFDTAGDPWELDVAPGGKLYYGTKDGELYRASNGNLSLVRSFEVFDKNTQGLLGIEADRREETTNIYLVRTAERDNKTSEFGDRQIYINYVERYNVTEDGLSDRKVLMKYSASGFHGGGRISVSPDNKLYVTTGDASSPQKAQNKSYNSGSIHRLNLDGSVPENNPYNSTVYSVGHRNAQGIAWTSGEQGFFSEIGGWRKDEINQLSKGANYGYPFFECRKQVNAGTDLVENASQTTFPERCFKDFTLAPSGMAFYEGSENILAGRILQTGLRGKTLLSYEVENGTISNERVFYTAANTSHISNRLRDVESFEDSIYVLGDSHGIAKLTPARRG
jgi:glucose/arabinose dehydrogenase